MAIGQVLSGGISAYGQVQNAKFQSELAKQNAAFREFDAKDAMLRGNQQSQKVRRAAAQTKGEIELAAGAQGQSVAAGSVAGNLLAEADVLSERDVGLIRNNAMREAFGYRLQGSNMITQAGMNEGLAWSQAGQTIATAGLQAAQTYSSSQSPTVKQVQGVEAKTGIVASNNNYWRTA